MLEKNWSLASIPNQSGKTVIVTGGNIGLGFKSALELARKGAHVVIACRSLAKGNEAMDRICQEVPGAALEVIQLDLSDRDSIKSFADTFCQSHDSLDILINNAGVVNLETLQRCPEGHEMHMATNHLGHFALTGLLAHKLLSTKNSRVVTLSSGAYKSGEIDFSDFKREIRPYSRVKAYGDSKLANLLFAHQLQKYFQSQNANCISVSAHPGLTGTERQQSIGIGGNLARWLASPVEKGVRPQLLAATSPQVEAGGFYGPRFVAWGAPALLKLEPEIITDELAKELWDYSEQVTAVKFPAA